MQPLLLLSFLKNLFVLAVWWLKAELVSGDGNFLYVDLAFLRKATIFEHSAVQIGFENFSVHILELRKVKFEVTDWSMEDNSSKEYIWSIFILSSNFFPVIPVNFI